MIQHHRELFTSFNPSASRLDTLMLDTMSRTDTYSKLWKLVKMLLVLSHGQATVERGFSMNKFDMVTHVCKFGLRGVVLQWFRSYLCDRSFRVVIGSGASFLVHLDFQLGGTALMFMKADRNKYVNKINWVRGQFLVRACSLCTWPTWRSWLMSSG